MSTAWETKRSGVWVMRQTRPTKTAPRRDNIWDRTLIKKPAPTAKKAAASNARVRSQPGTAKPKPNTSKVAPDDVIYFYRANEKPYGAFSNLYPRPIEYEGHTYSTSEHAYQAGKAIKPAVRDWILSAPTPSLAAMAAHGLYVWDVVPNWAEIKFDRMRAVLRAKFEQHADLKALLLSTGEARLVEAGTVNNAVNRLWGEVEGKGQNMLGVMLMELRSEYSNSAPKAKRVTGTASGKSAKALSKQSARSTNRPLNSRPD